MHHVLNECLIDRGASPSMVTLELSVDGHHVTTVQVRLGFGSRFEGLRVHSALKKCLMKRGTSLALAITGEEYW